MKFILLILFSLFYFVSFSQKYTGNDEVNQSPIKAAGCSPASGKVFLEFNNVKSLTHTGGNLWQVPATNTAVYEVPKGSGIQALFASSLWLGGVDVNNQLKLAAVRYRTGNDYWAGPLTDDGTAEIIPEECIKYDKHFVVNRDEVEEFNAWFNAGLNDQQNGTSTQADNFSEYEIPESILEWPAHGDPGLGQDYYLAPFFDRDEDGNYEPQNGDYPWYDLTKSIDCKTDRTVTLYGDQTVWWVMNDKGNIHTETGGDPLGMEIKAQAFAFATNDEVNNMTFYNYELINRSTQTLFNTYFGVFVDVALGDPQDDFVGCDVSRGLGYAYNGDAYDGNNLGFYGYGNNPPAIGVDFFEGPYQDNDGIDNQYGIGPGQAVEGNGLGYSDGIIDNERFGMRRFLYYNNVGSGNANQTDPITSTDYYNYLRGFWKDGTKFLYGGTGHYSDGAADPSVPCDFMFPGDSDPLGWGTSGQQLPAWTEVTAGNVPYDRRFAQSAGPFILEPGAVNNITVGVVYARASTGDPFESVNQLRIADDKAQALFDNCFRVMDGPEAPELSIQELENELILTINNPTNSNNYLEKYEELDPFLVKPISISDSLFNNKYTFQGYQIFQLKNKDVAVSDIDDPDLARIVFQCDIKDGISDLINFEYDDEIGASIPVLKVEGENNGIRKSINVKEDLFAVGANKKLINHKEYFYIAISYANNNYKEYLPGSPNNYDGQKIPYIRSRKAPVGEIKPQSGIPHISIPESSGTFIQADYGDEPQITRIDGIGHGTHDLKIIDEDEVSIVNNQKSGTVTYASGRGPITVKIIDPINVKGNTFEIIFKDSTGNSVSDLTYWLLIDKETNDTLLSEQSIQVLNEQLFPEYGISVLINNTQYDTYGAGQKKTNFLSAQIIYEDSSKLWLSGVADNDVYYPTNWILSGTQDEDCLNNNLISDPCLYNDVAYDENQKFEAILNGTIAPWYLVNQNAPFTPGANTTSFNGLAMTSAVKKEHLNNIDVVFTANKDLWTRCVIIEMCDEPALAQGQVNKMALRSQVSVNKDGQPDNTGTNGMGWFPGYALDLETGERLNIAFGENSSMPAQNGRDMIWNPSSTLFNSSSIPKFGGMHTIYVFSSRAEVPSYDEGTYIYQKLNTGGTANLISVFRNCMWVLNPLLSPNEELLSSKVRVELRVEKPYEKKVIENTNNGLPHYRFDLATFQPQIINSEVYADSILNQIKVVPNPYYGTSGYEVDRLDDRVKFTNLTPKCTIKIFNMSGALVKQIVKDNPLSSQDWDLKNHNGIRVSSGVYIIHIEIPEVGEKVLKWFGNMKQINIENF